MLPRLERELRQALAGDQFLVYYQPQIELASGRIDLGMDVPLPLTDSIHRTRLGREWLSVVVRQGHPLTHEPLTLPRYLAQQHIVVSSRSRGLSAEEYELAAEAVRAAGESAGFKL